MSFDLDIILYRYQQLKSKSIINKIQLLGGIERHYDQYKQYNITRGQKSLI